MTLIDWKGLEKKFPDEFKDVDRDMIARVEKAISAQIDEISLGFTDLYGTYSTYSTRPDTTLTAESIKRQMEEAYAAMHIGWDRAKGSDTTAFNVFGRQSAKPENPLAKGAITLAAEDVRDATNDVTRKDRMIDDGRVSEGDQEIGPRADGCSGGEPGAIQGRSSGHNSEHFE